ncbi:eukaryotic translation initiation factor 3 subunit G-domain-containing protein [Kickxella alabastrina]|uniref:eukaryotic translation initiation factor 3 subunit G-domain-containing protein n=1 Tax=Kickxella alabastrina TaxID=61397 RepID=UPI0022211E8B|nr:eukaryotic translation initiation factor 3 subunit G-domain-containing protein [Kickxella alabastrina]KAI7822416.1 eukaryotic translation initiation factor 3 subunit G-domain-containing protein [Kickxella alabastrina]
MSSQQPTTTNWADDELDEQELPQAEVIQNDDGTRTVIEYHLNEDGKKVKVTRRMQGRVVQEKVNRAVAERKKWAKFGAEKNSAPGPKLQQPTSLSQYAAQQKQQELDVMEAEKKAAVKSSQIRCRTCRGLHFTALCPYKDTLVPLEEITGAAAAATDAGASAGAGAAAGGNSIRITNLSEDTQEEDVRQLCKPFGSVSRAFVAIDRNTGACKGYAFVSFHEEDAAKKAIAKLNGYGFDNLILSAEWANSEKKL